MHGVFERYKNIESVVIYGSRALGTQRPDSDIDITLIGKGLNLDDQLQISAELSDLALPYSFDVSIYTMIENQDLVAHIDRVGKQVYPSVEGGKSN